jgi:hypothetical protein
MVAELEYKEANPADPTAPLTMNVSPVLRSGDASAGRPDFWVPLAEAARRRLAGGLPVPGDI